MIFGAKIQNLFDLLSLQIVIPVFGDQPSNGLEAQSRGYGISIPLPELTTEKLQESVDRVLSDPTFSQKAQEHGAMVMDQINTPLERAVWWLEYAMRYPGMKHMRSPVHDLHWTQYLLLDVVAFFIGIFLTFNWEWLKNFLEQRFAFTHLCLNTGL